MLVLCLEAYIVVPVGEGMGDAGYWCHRGRQRKEFGRIG